jgi:crotonobetainyl-CoA:carnitine CoA-transferase CaiB-like acyl-CoA transferase
MALPLDGVRVLDLSNVLSGPLCSYQLAMMGAEVIKIERPVTGDLSRRMGADPKMGAARMGASFCGANAGKKSVTLNLKNKRGAEIFKLLVKDAGVVLENYRPGVMKKLGLDYAALKEINPGVIYCAISGFGQKGPLAQRPSYDQIIQGFSGIMSLTGDKNSAPLRAGYQVCDTVAGITGAFAIASALYRQQKTGEGEMIDLSMLDATLASTAIWTISNYLMVGKIPEPMGNENVTASPSGTYRIGDKLLNIVNNEQKQYEKLCDAIGMPELKADPRFAERNDRVKNRYELRGIVERALQERSADEWEALFEEIGVPAGPILSVPEVMGHPQIRQRGLVKSFSKVPGIERDIEVLRLGFDLESGSPDVGSPPPRLGQDTADVLGSVGLTAGDLEELRQQGAI